MGWPFEKNNNPEVTEKPGEQPNPDPANAAAKPEKSQAELIAEALAPLREGFNSLKDELAAVREQTRRPERQPEQHQPTSVFDDEDAAFAQRMTPVLARQLDIESRLVKSDIRKEYEKAGYGELWEQNEAAIDDILARTPLVDTNMQPQRGNPDYIRNTVDMVFGRAARKAGLRFGGKSQGFFLESAGGSSDATVPDAEAGFDAKQLKVLKRMGVPLESAKKIMSKAQMVS